jgi:LacI family transcriptional regulator
MGLRGYKPIRRERATEQIEELIRRENLWGRRLPGEREIAEELGISRGTVQKSLEMLEARGVVVRRQGSGTFAAEKAAVDLHGTWAGKHLCILTPRDFMPGEGWSYYGDMIRGAQRGARRAQLRADILAVEDCWSDAPESGWGRLRDFDAFILVQREDHALISSLLRLRRGPVVLLDSVVRDLPVLGVVDGSFEGARRAVSYLVKLGHRRIAYLAPGEDRENPHEKTQGYRAALSQARISPVPELIASPGYAENEARIRAAVRGFMQLPEPPTALFAGVDSRALVALDELERLGVRMGSEFALVGFGDSAFRLGQCDRLTSVRIYTRLMGEAAVRAVLDSGGLAGARTVIVPDRLVVRGTSCRAPAKSRASLALTPDGLLGSEEARP